MRPIFEEPPLPFRTPGQTVQIGAIIGAQPRESRQVMGARKQVDAVDLVELDPVQQARERRGTDRVTAACRKPRVNMRRRQARPRCNTQRS